MGTKNSQKNQSEIVLFGGQPLYLCVRPLIYVNELGQFAPDWPKYVDSARYLLTNTPPVEIKLSNSQKHEKLIHDLKRALDYWEGFEEPDVLRKVETTDTKKLLIDGERTNPNHMLTLSFRDTLSEIDLDRYKSDDPMVFFAQRYKVVEVATEFYIDEDSSANEELVKQCKDSLGLVDPWDLNPELFTNSKGMPISKYDK